MAESELLPHGCVLGHRMMSESQFFIDGEMMLESEFWFSSQV